MMTQVLLRKRARVWNTNDTE